jgi:rhodanese-related sulfurtransferase
MKNRFVQGILLIVIAAVIAVTSNAVAGRTRRLVLPGWYPNATQVPAPPAPPPVTSGAAGVSPAVPVAVAEVPVPAPPGVDARDARRSTEPAQPAKSVAVATVTSPPAPAAAPAVSVLERFKPHPDKAYIEISGEDVMALHKAGALFLDARRSAAFEEGHIQGARPFSVWESDIDEKVNKLFEERSDPESQAKPIVIYCTGGACEDSHMLSQKLWGIQFNNVYVYKDGFPDWQKRGGAIAK